VPPDPQSAASRGEGDVGDADAPLLRVAAGFALIRDPVARAAAVHDYLVQQRDDEELRVMRAAAIREALAAGQPARVVADALLLDVRIVRRLAAGS